MPALQKQASPDQRQALFSEVSAILARNVASIARGGQGFRCSVGHVGTECYAKTMGLRVCEKPSEWAIAVMEDQIPSQIAKSSAGEDRISAILRILAFEGTKEEFESLMNSEDVSLIAAAMKHLGGSTSDNFTPQHIVEAVSAAHRYGETRQGLTA